MSLMRGCPNVSVPVLSIKSTSARASVSRYLLPLMSKPRFAPAPIDAIIAIGVARAKAHEQATTSTAAVASGSRRTRKVSAAIPATTGRYQVEKANEDWGFIKTVVNILFLVIFRILFILFYLFIYKYVVLIIMAPVLAILSEKTDEIISGNKYPFNLRQFFNDVMRGIKIASRNLFIELSLILLLFFITFIPLVGFLSAPLIFLIECYFYGFSMMDYSNERKRLTIRESTTFINRHKGIAVANGAVFYMLMLVPVVGLMIAPAYGVVAAAIAAEKVR